MRIGTHLRRQKRRRELQKPMQHSTNSADK
jgi:hypothetical protein